jgi:hypothetical protein
MGKPEILGNIRAAPTMRSTKAGHRIRLENIELKCILKSRRKSADQLPAQCVHHD